MRYFLPVLLVLAPCLQAADDAVLKAMRDELQRSMTLQFNSLDKPYYLEYMMEDGYRLQVTAMLGGIVSIDQSQFRIPRLRLRIGSPQFDNTNYVGGRNSYAGRSGAMFPLDDDYAAIRHSFWLATDQSYKAALETISRKHAALKNVSVTEELPDFSPAQQAKMVLNFTPAKISPEPWVSRVKAISAAFLKFPQLRDSSVEYSAEDGARRLVTSEGGELHLPEQECELRIQTSAQAKDGMTVRDSALFESLTVDGLPSQAELLKMAEDLGATVTALAKAPRGDDYSGPVLFDGVASAQIMAELLGHNLAMSRKPVADSGAGGGVGGSAASELEGRVGSRILPESFSVRDDPTLKEWKGHHLFGTMRVDEDGVEAKPLSIVEKGVLKNVLLTRQPVRGFPTTNARARLQGGYGNSVAGVTNLIVQSDDVVPVAELKSKMIDMLKQRDKPFGIVVRKMDFPSSASGGEVRRLIMASARSGGSRPISVPLRVYRVYQDGHEEMVRGLRFRALNVRSLKDIVAVADDTNVLNYPENGQPFAMLGGGGETAETTVIAPSLLIDDLELVRMEDEQPKLPIVPAPELSFRGVGFSLPGQPRRLAGRPSEPVAGSSRSTVDANLPRSLGTQGGAEGRLVKGALVQGSAEPICVHVRSFAASSVPDACSS
jgi:TldD protein